MKHFNGTVEASSFLRRHRLGSSFFGQIFSFTSTCVQLIWPLLYLRRYLDKKKLSCVSNLPSETQSVPFLLSLIVFLCPSGVSGSAPGKRPSHHLKKTFVGLPEVLTELLQGLRAQWSMWSAFRLIQALIMSSGQKAVKAFGGIEVKVVWVYSRWQVKKPFRLPQLWEWIPDKRITIHHMNLLPGEDLQPAGEMQMVQAPLQCLVALVNVALVEQELLQWLVGLVLCQAVVKYLGVVRHQPLCRIPDNKQQPDGRVHVPHTSWNLRSCKIARRLLHCKLAWEGEGHLSSVPSQTAAIMLLHVEEMHLRKILKRR